LLALFAGFLYSSIGSGIPVKKQSQSRSRPLIDAYRGSADKSDKDLRENYGIGKVKNEVL
jgi:hypothetical protein